MPETAFSTDALLCAIAFKPSAAHVNVMHPAIEIVASGFFIDVRSTVIGHASVEDGMSLRRCTAIAVVDLDRSKKTGAGVSQSNTGAPRRPQDASAQIIYRIRVGHIANRYAGQLGLHLQPAAKRHDFWARPRAGTNDEPVRHW